MLLIKDLRCEKPTRFAAEEGLRNERDMLTHFRNIDSARILNPCHISPDSIPDQPYVLTESIFAGPGCYSRTARRIEAKQSRQPE